MDFSQIARRGRDEDGTVLIIVAGCLVLFLVLLAMTIDLGSGYTAHEKAQSAADAGALAAAEAIRTGATGTAVTNAATDEANTNYPGATINVSTSGDGQTATVAVSAPISNGFGSEAGLGGERVSASSQASPSYTATTVTNITTGSTTVLGTTLTTSTTLTPGTTVTSTTSTTTTPSPNTAIFANDTTCDGGLTVGGSLLTTGILANLLPANSVNIPSSTVISNGNEWVNSVNLTANGSSFIYGGPNGCASAGLGNASATRSSATYGFPQTYTASSIPCTQNGTNYSSNGTPSAGVYCDTGSITLYVCGNENFSGVTLIAPTITIQPPLLCLFGSNITGWTPAQSGYPLAWATGGGGLTVYLPLGGSLGFSGVLDASNGPLDITAGNTNASGLIEGQEVGLDTNTLNLTGSGPKASGTTTTTVTVPTTATATSVSTATTTATVPTVGSTTSTGTTTGPSSLNG